MKNGEERGDGRAKRRRGTCEKSGRDVGAGQGDGIFAGEAAGGQSGWMKGAGRDGAGWEGARGKRRRLMWGRPGRAEGTG